MAKLASINKWQVLGLIGILALPMVAATVIIGVLVSDPASAHGGDAPLVHACVNQTNAKVVRWEWMSNADVARIFRNH